MQKPEKPAEPSMEEILASIRKIIAEEPGSADGADNKDLASTPPLAEKKVEGSDTAPPSADLSDILDEPVSDPASGQLTAFPARPRTEPAPSARSQERQMPGQLLPGLAEDSNPFFGPAGKPADPSTAEAGVDLVETDDQQDSPLVSRLKGLSSGLTPDQSGPVSSEPDNKTEPAKPSGTGAVEVLVPSPTPSGSETPTSVKNPAGTDKGSEASKPPLAAKDDAVAMTATAVEAKTVNVPSADSAKSKAAGHDDLNRTKESPPVAVASSAVAASLNALTASPGNVAADADQKADASSLATAPDAASKSSEQSPPELTDNSGSASTPLEAALSEVLRPTVEKWLETNLPALIDEAVRKKLDKRD
ncbi:MAG: DUF2497 domain-containing protein [Hyphomicrobiaceae bacterium]